MDHLTPQQPSVASRVRRVAGEAGILPDDPLGPVVEALADIPAEVDLRIGPALAEMRALTAAVEKIAAQPAGTVLTDKQTDDIGRRLLGSCQAWSRGLVRASMWRSWALIGATVAVVFAAGMGAGWVLTKPASELQCADQSDGSRACWFYTKLPTPPIGRKS